MKKTITTSVLVLISFVLSSQYYYNKKELGQNPGGLNIEQETSLASMTGWNQILGSSNTSPVWSTTESIPFPFNFNGALVSQYKVSSSGVLTFNTTASSVPSYTKAILPSSSIPDESICVWGIGATGSNDAIGTKIFGIAPNRQHWIYFASFSLAPGTSGNWSYWSIVLEESTNNIYVVDQRQNLTTSGVSVGVQINSSTAYSVVGSPNVVPQALNDGSQADNIYYEFIYGSRPAYDLATVTSNTTPVVNTNDAVTISATLENLGTQTVTAFDVNYKVNNGALVTTSVTSVSVTSGGNSSFSSSTPWIPNSSGTYNIDVWASNINGNPDQNQANDVLSITVVVKDTIPNRFQDYINALPSNYNSDVIVNSSNQIATPNDLDFHPFSDQLWIVNKGTENSGSPMITVNKPGKSGQASFYRKDANAKHFMNSTTGIAFGENGMWANSPGVFDANFSGGANAFTGPSLWESDSLIFAQPSGGNGSHMDMLHASSHAMGIAHEKDNVYWVFDSHQNDVVRYDFGVDHGPGGSNHDDGKIRRYPELNVSRINLNIPSHMVINKKTNWLYIVDGGSKRVLKADINSGNIGGTPSYGPFEVLSEYSNVTGVTWSNIVTTGLVEPSGIDVIGGNMIVSDYNTGEIVMYDISGVTANELGRISTGSTGVTGVVIGPEGYFWYTNALTNEVVKIRPALVSGLKENSKELNISLYPNPSNNGVFKISNNKDVAQFLVYDYYGKLILNETNRSGKIDLSKYNKGVFVVKLLDAKGGVVSVKKAIVK